MKELPVRNDALAKQLNRLAWMLSGMVLILVGLMRRVKVPLPEGWDLSFLPAVHAVMNSGTFVALLLAFFFIKRRQVDKHRRAIYAATILSILFLLSYVTYHFLMPETIYGDLNGDGRLSQAELTAAGSMRTVYLFLLLSHIALAAISFPFILFTFIRGYAGQVQEHRRMARWVWPIWLYVAATGPLVYWMLRPYYGS